MTTIADHTHPTQWGIGNILAVVGITVVGLGIIIALTFNGIGDSRIDSLHTRMDAVQQNMAEVQKSQVMTESRIAAIKLDVAGMRRDITDIKETLARIEAAQR